MKPFSRNLSLFTLLAAAMLAAPGLVGCGGGEDQASNCTVEELASGQTRIECPDGSTALISGPTGEATSCTFDQEGDEIRITCDDGTDLVLRDGIDGTSGSSCSVEEHVDGTASIVCDDGSSTTIGTPAPGLPAGALALELLGGVTSVGTTDGVGTETRMDGALDGVYDPTGEFLYFVDTFNMTIRRFGLRTGRVITLAGQAGQKGASDGLGTAATFEGPRGIAIHPDGERVFIADGFNCTIRELNLTTTEVTTLTGQPGECAAADGAFEDARFRLTIGMVMDSTGRYLYAADRGNNVIRRIDLEDQIVETIGGQLPLEGPGQFRGFADGIGPAAQFAGPGGIDLSADETILYINDTFNNVIRTLRVQVSDDDPSQELFEVTTIAGSPGQGGNVDGIGADARFRISQGLARAADGLFVAGFHNSIRRIDLQTYEVTTVAGQNGVGGSSDGPSFDARFGVSFGILAHPDGRRLYYMDRGNNNIRLFDRLTGEVTTVMGAPEPTGWKDGPVNTSRFHSPRGVVANADGTRFFISDRTNQVIRMFNAETGYLSTLAGLPGRSGFADGIADEARFTDPEGLWLDEEETYLYIADYSNDAIRRLELSTGMVTTLAGRPLLDDEEHQDGTLTTALFDLPYALAGHVVGDGLVLYVSDYGSDLIRRIDLGAGEVTTIAGGAEENTENPAAIDGIGADARFDGPTGLVLSPNGETLYVADQFHHVIRSIALSSGEVTTLVGDIGVRDAFDGVGDDATFSNPAHLAITSDGQTLVVADRTNYAIRKVDLPSLEVTTLIGALGTAGGSSSLFTPLEEARLYFTAGVTIVNDDVVFTADQALLRVSSLLNASEGE